MIKRWKLTDIQAEAILNMRLRALRRLEEIAIKKELDELARRRQGAEGAARRREAAMEGDRRRDGRASRKEFGAGPPLGKRRTEIGAPPAGDRRCRSRRWSSASR